MVCSITQHINLNFQLLLHPSKHTSYRAYCSSFRLQNRPKLYKIFDFVIIMHSNAVILLFPLVVTLVSAGCYSRGESGNKGTASTAVDSYVCQQLSGYYVPQQERTACVVGQGESVSWYLSVKQEGWGGTISAKDCSTNIKKEIDGCRVGGHTRDGDWSYTYVPCSILNVYRECATDLLNRADPQNGICQDTNYQNAHPNGKAKRDGASSEAQSGTRAPRAALMQRALGNVTTLHFEGSTMVVYDVSMPERVSA